MSNQTNAPGKRPKENQTQVNDPERSNPSRQAPRNDPERDRNKRSHEDRSSDGRRRGDDEDLEE